MEGEENVLLLGHIVAYTTEFALNGNAIWIVGRGSDGVERRAALRISIVMVILVCIVSGIASKISRVHEKPLT